MVFKYLSLSLNKLKIIVNYGREILRYVAGGET